MEEYCVCGHTKGVHISDNIPCGGCMDFRDEYVEESIRKGKHPFQLDNLRFIEDLAKEQGLV